MLEIRQESAEDHGAIRELLLSAFPLPSEAGLVERLRADGDVVIALVALEDGALLGHVMLSPLSAPFPALALAPVTVHSQRRNEGIGRKLVAEALERVRGGGWQGVFVVGDPDYYARFGFDAKLASGFTSVYAGPYLMAMPLGGETLPCGSGAIAFAPAFASFE